MEVGDQPVDRLEAIAGRDEDRRVALERLDGAVVVRPRFRAGASEVVPTAISRPPDARTAFSRSAVSASIRPHSACILCSLVSSALTGRKVPAPTCRVSVSRPMPCALQRLDQARREVQRRGRRGDRPVLPREHGLVIVAVGLVGRAPRGDVGRQRHPAGALEQQLDRLLAIEVQQDGAFVISLGDGGRHAAAEFDRVADRAGAWRCGRTPTIRAALRACAASRRCALRRGGPSSCAGMTLVSLKTSVSPGRSSVRQVEHGPVRNRPRPRPAAAAR